MKKASWIIVAVFIFGCGGGGGGSSSSSSSSNPPQATVSAAGIWNGTAYSYRLAHFLAVMLSQFDRLHLKIRR